MNVTDKVKELRKKYSQAELGKLLGTSQSNIFYICNGRKNVRYDLGVRIDRLYKQETSKAAAS